MRCWSALVQALVRGSATRLAPVMAPLRKSTAPWLRGYRVRVVDGNHLPASEKRLEPLRGFRDAALPGHSLVVYDPDAGLVTGLVPCEDGHASEQGLLAMLLAAAQPGELWIGDRLFCTRAAILAAHERGAAVLFRESSAYPKPTPTSKRRRIGRIETGIVYELATAVRARSVARLYRKRWTIEGLFGRLEAALQSEVRILGYPRAALLAFGPAVIAFNVLAVIEAAIAAAHDLEAAELTISTYYVADDVRSDYSGMLIAIETESWTAFDDLTAAAFARTLRQIATHVDPRKLCKHPRGPKPKSSKGYAPAASVRRHVATARVLRDGKIQ